MIYRSKLNEIFSINQQKSKKLRLNFLWTFILLLDRLLRHGINAAQKNTCDQRDQCQCNGIMDQSIF